MRRDLDSLHPLVRAKAMLLKKLASAIGIDIIFTSTLRTMEEQEALYAQGRLELEKVNALRIKAGLPKIKESSNVKRTWTMTSPHIEARAFDIVPIREGRAVWINEDINSDGLDDYDQIGKLGESLGLTWGGRFRGKDKVHFELSAQAIEEADAAAKGDIHGA